MTKIVLIRGDEWKFEDILESILVCKKSKWIKQKWESRPALISKKGGKVTLYLGQKFDPEKTTLVDGGWDHDHCEICWWDLFETEDIEHGTGYFDGASYICVECFKKFIETENI